MGRGVCSGGGRSSLGYLFGFDQSAVDIPAVSHDTVAGADDVQKKQTNEEEVAARLASAYSLPPWDVTIKLPAAAPASKHMHSSNGAAQRQTAAQRLAALAPSNGHEHHCCGGTTAALASQQVPAGVLVTGTRPSNNYLRTANPNTGNFITDRPSTRVHSPPGGISSLGYLLGGTSR